MRGRGGKKPKLTGRSAPPSLSQMMTDDVMKLAQKFWLHGVGEGVAFEPKLVGVIYQQELRKTGMLTQALAAWRGKRSGLRTKARRRHIPAGASQDWYAYPSSGCMAWEKEWPSNQSSSASYTSRSFARLVCLPKLWLHGVGEGVAFEPKLVGVIYQQELRKTGMLTQALAAWRGRRSGLRTKARRRHIPAGASQDWYAYPSSGCMAWEKEWPSNQSSSASYTSRSFARLVCLPKLWLHGVGEGVAFEPKLVGVIYQQELRKTGMLTQALAAWRGRRSGLRTKARRRHIPAGASQDLYAYPSSLWNPLPRTRASNGMNEDKDKLGGFSAERIMFLEFTRYLENYLWPHFDEDATEEHVISVVALINEKFREGVPPWDFLRDSPSEAPLLFSRALRLLAEEEGGEGGRGFRERTQLLVFLSNALASVEVDLVRDELKHLVSLSSWERLSEPQRARRFSDFPKLKKLYSAVKKKEGKMGEEEAATAAFRRNFLWNLLGRMNRLVHLLPDDVNKVSEELLRFLERFLELLIGLESSLLTRRFFDAVLEASLFIPRAQLSVLADADKGGDRGRLFRELLGLLTFYRRFELDESGQALAPNTVAQRHYNRLAQLQRATFKKFPEKMRTFYLSNIASLDEPVSLRQHLSVLSREELLTVCEWLDLVGETPEPPSRELLLHVLVSAYSKRESQLSRLLEMPLYPTEAAIWNLDKVPNDFVQGDRCFAAPKLNLQFLTIQDYLYRNFELFLDEATYEVRQDIEDALIRMKPWQHESDPDEVVWGGWARMALPVQNFAVVEVSKPRIGERAPSSVRADIGVTLGRRGDVRAEWENLRRHDVLFILAVRPKVRVGTKLDVRTPFAGQVEVVSVRGCEVEGMLGPDGRIIEEFGFDQPKPKVPGDGRTWRVWLDPNQYYLDMESSVRHGKADVYDSFNVLIRRNPKENNFKSVLETIRQLLNTKCVVPDWLEELLLGYGAPDAAHYSKFPSFSSLRPDSTEP